MDDIVSRRIGKILELGSSLALVLREEILDMEMKAGDEVKITLYQDQQEKKIVIEKI